VKPLHSLSRTFLHSLTISRTLPTGRVQRYKTKHAKRMMNKAIVKRQLRDWRAKTIGKVFSRSEETALPLRTPLGPWA